jgi:hypothetical protein
MIFRRRRIRIEIEESTVRMASGADLAGFESPVTSATEAPTPATNLVSPPSVPATLPANTALPRNQETRS